jgi:hypothetical protein
VLRRRVRVPEQALANVEGRDAVAEADLDRPRSLLTQDPLPQRLALGGVHRHREDAMKRAVRTRDGGAVANQALDHAAHP